MSIQAIPLENFGAEIEGLDLSVPISDDIGAELNRLWLKHGILLFRGMGTDSRSHTRLAKVFGPLQQHPVAAVRLKEDPDLMLLATENDEIPVQVVNGEVRRSFIYWHSDMAYVPEINKGALLRMVETPERGGDTGWTDTAAAFRDLPRDMQERLESMHMIQAWRAAVDRPWGWPDLDLHLSADHPVPARPAEELPPVRQPMVVTHPESGIKSMLLSPLCYSRIEGMDQEQSDLLFEDLCRHALQEKYRYVHKWLPGDMVLWDNYRTMHCAFGYPFGMKRHAQRCTLADSHPTGEVWRPTEAA